ncbi:MAG TPA: PAS domain S-box protein [Anaerolineae bacterium]|nr:PAS domain S-box protein [Anaerolineae bacterium]
MKEATSRKQLERILETIAEGIYIISTDAVIMYANGSAEEILGVKRSDLIGSPYSDPGYKLTTLEGKPYPIEERPIIQALRTGNLVRNVEYVVIRPDGRRVIISTNAAPLRDEEGNIIGAILSFADITARKQAEEDLRESERRFREMLEGVELIALMLDTQGNIIFGNDFLLNLTGWQRDEVIGKNWFDYFIPEENQEEIKQVFHEVITRGIPAHYENDIVTLEGERHTIAFSNVLLRDRQGNVIGTASIGHDVTAERQAAEEIRDSRKQVLDILESITDGFFALDNDWRFTYVNSIAAQLIGRRREQLLFRNMWEVLPELEGSIFDKEYHRAKEEMVPRTFEAFYPPLNRWFEVHAYPYEKGFSVYVSDITERKKVEEAFKESEERYRSLVELSPDGIAVHSEGKLVYANPATVKMFGAANANQLIGKPVISFVHPNYRELVIERNKQMQQGKKVGIAEEKFIRVDGSPIDVEVAASPIIYMGKPAIQVVFRDITERQRIEEALRESENRYRTLFEDAPIALWEQDASGITAHINELKKQGVKDFRAYFEQHPEVTAEMLATIKIIDVNRTVLKLYGASSKEEFIRNFGATFTKEGLDAAKEFLISYAEKEEVKFEAEFTSRTLKGDTIYVSVISFIPPGFEETRSKIFIATVDITKRKKVEEALRSSQALLQSIIDNTTAVIYVKDREGRYILINRQYEVLFHIKREEIVGKTDYDFFPKERVDAVRVNDQKVLEIGEPLEFEEVVPVNGELHTYISIKFPLRDPQGNIYGVCGISTDITDRERAEEALKESEARFRKVFEEGPLGMAIVGLDYRFVKVNAKLTQMLGYTEEELTKLTFTEITHPDDVDRDIGFVQKLVSGEMSSYQTEKRYIKKSGEPFWASTTASIVRDEKGNPRYFLPMVEDIEERKRVEEELAREKGLSDALNDINAAVTSTLDFNEIMQRIIVKSAKAIGVEKAAVLLREDAYWAIRYVYGWPKEMIGTRLTDEEATLTILMSRTRTLAVVNDALHDERVNPEVIERFGIRSLMAIPLIVRGDFIGTLYFSYHSAPVTFTEAQIDFAGKLAVAISVALENARLFEEFTVLTDKLDQRSKNLQTLLDVALDITSGLKLDELMRRIAKNATELIGADVGAVGLAHEETRAVTYPFIYNLPEYFAKTDVPPGRGLSGIVIFQKKPMVLEDYQEFDDKIPVFAATGLRSIAMVPLWSRGRIIGVLWVSNLDPEKKFDERDLATLEGIGRHAAIALENARLYEAERHIADTLQDALLSVPEKVDHLEYGKLYHSATEAARVGGDFYDLFELEHNRVGLTVGDIAGKGLEAAALTVVVKNTIRAYALEGYDPAQIMAKTNEAIRAVSSPSMFVTVFFAIFDKNTKRLVYCNAGHPPAIMKRKSLLVELLEMYSPIIGAFPDLRYKNGVTTLSSGDTLILYTDGVIEARRDGEFFEEDHLIEFVRELEPISAKEVPRAIFDEVLRFSSGRLQDDVALLALAYKGE